MRNFNANEINDVLNEIGINLAVYGEPDDYCAYAQNLKLCSLTNANVKELYDTYAFSNETFFYLLLSSNANHFISEIKRIVQKLAITQDDKNKILTITKPIYQALQAKQTDDHTNKKFISAVDFFHGTEHQLNRQQLGNGKPTVTRHTTTFELAQNDWNVTFTEQYSITPSYQYNSTLHLIPTRTDTKNWDALAHAIAFTAVYRILSSVDCANAIITVHNIEKITDDDLRKKVLINCQIMCNLYGAIFNLNEQPQTAEEVKKEAQQKHSIQNFVGYIEENYTVAQLVPLFKDVRDFYDQLAQVERKPTLRNINDIAAAKYQNIQHMLGQKRNDTIDARLTSLISQYHAPTIQACYRGFVARKKFKQQNDAATTIQACYRRYAEHTIRKLINIAGPSIDDQFSCSVMMVLKRIEQQSITEFMEYYQDPTSPTQAAKDDSKWLDMECDKDIYDYFNSKVKACLNAAQHIAILSKLDDTCCKQLMAIISSLTLEVVQLNESIKNDLMINNKVNMVQQTLATRLTKTDNNC